MCARGAVQLIWSFGWLPEQCLGQFVTKKAEKSTGVYSLLFCDWLAGDEEEDGDEQGVQVDAAEQPADIRHLQKHRGKCNFPT
jgi:hypothetical protein